MKKKFVFLFLILWGFSAYPQGPLKVSPNQRHLVKADGSAFFWLGDTAWELFHRLNREQATQYLINRVEKGFTVIQAVALAELDGLNTPNPYGDKPLLNNDPTTPNEAYFKHVDFIVDKAAELGLFIGLLPTWGDKVFKDRWGTGPEIFNPENAKIYGKWIGTRYQDRKNIVWILGGDRNPRNDQDVAIWRAMAAGITEAVGGADKALITFHPQPNDLADAGSAKWFHNDAWLDFNMFQTGHCRENNVWDRIQVAYKKRPSNRYWMVKPYTKITRFVSMPKTWVLPALLMCASMLTWMYLPGLLGILMVATIFGRCTINPVNPLTARI